MNAFAHPTGHPLLESTSLNKENQLRIFLSNEYMRCHICRVESKANYLVCFNIVACQVCFDFIVNLSFNHIEYKEINYG